MAPPGLQPCLRALLRHERDEHKLRAAKEPHAGHHTALHADARETNSFPPSGRSFKPCAALGTAAWPKAIPPSLHGI